MTSEEKYTFIEKNLEADPELKAEYEALMAQLPSPEEAERLLAADPALRERYNAVMSKATRGMELSDDELDDISGGAIDCRSLPVSAFLGLRKGGSVRPQANGLVHRSTDSPKINDLVYRPVKPITTKDDPDTSGQIVYL